MRAVVRANARADHTHTHTHFFFLFWIPSRRPAKRTRCHAGKGAEPRAVPNLVVKMLMLKASGSSGHLLYCDGQDEQVTLNCKNHQTQCQCRISWDRKQSLLVDPIRAPTRDNASRLGGLAPRELRTLKPDAPGAACRTLDDCQGRRPHGRSWNCHDKVASYVGKEAGPSRIG